VLYYKDTLGSSSAVLLGYVRVLMCYTIVIPLGPYVLYYRDTLGSSYAIL